MNKHGLTRNIPEDIKRQVRQRDGFGCIVCGSAIIEFEHLDPEFKDATKHTVEGIVLLCVACHAKKTRGLLSSATIIEHRERPAALKKGFSFGAFDIGPRHPTIHLGNATFSNTSRLLIVDGEEVLRVDPPEQENGPFRLSASIYDRNSAQILRIVENEWQTPTANWDVELVGRRLTVRSAHRSIDLILRSLPPNELIFERLRMNHRGVEFLCAEGGATTISGSSGMLIQAARMHFDGCEAAIDVSAGQCRLGGGGNASIERLVLGASSAAASGNFGPRIKLPDDHQVDSLVRAHMRARNERNLAVAHQIRTVLDQAGIEVMEGAQSSTWRRIMDQIPTWRRVEGGPPDQAN